MNSWPVDISINMSDTADPDLRKAIHEGIKAFNDQTSPAHRESRTGGVTALDIIVRDSEGRLAGGLVAGTYWGWLDIDDLWLREDMRKKGLGSALLETAEKEARRRGCRRAKLTTFSFQARSFYEKKGYHVVGQLEDYPPGASYYWMVKQLVSGQSSTVSSSNT